MRPHEEFGLSVSDDTIYRALKNLAFSHVECPAQGLQAECRGHGRIQKNFAERVEEIRAQLAPDIPVEVWFQMLWGRAERILRQPESAMELPRCNRLTTLIPPSTWPLSSVRQAG